MFLAAAGEIGHGKVGYVTQRCIWIGAWLEVNLDEAYAGQRAGFAVVDVGPKVKKRSNVFVMSASICWGGMPL